MKYFNEFTDEEKEIYYLGFEKGRQFTLKYIKEMAQDKLKKSRKKEEQMRESDKIKMEMLR